MIEQSGMVAPLAKMVGSCQTGQSGAENKDGV